MTLPLLAYDASCMHLTGSESVAGLKSFSEAPSIPTRPANDNSDRCASTGYVDAAIQNLIGTAPGTLDTLGEIATMLQADDASLNAILSTMVTTGTTQTITGSKTFSSIAVPTQTQANGTTAAASCSYVDQGLATKVSSLNPIFSGTLTSQSISDNGSFTASGNCTIGTTSSNTLLVKSTPTFQAPTTFSSTVTHAGQNLDSRISAVETAATNASAAASTNATAITTLQNKTANQSLSGSTTTIAGILAASTIHLSGTSLAETLASKANTSAPVFSTSFQSPSINDSGTAVTISSPTTISANFSSPSITDVSGTGVNISTPLTVAGQFISQSINDNGSRINANSLLSARAGFQIDGTNIGSIYQTQSGKSSYQTTAGMGAYAAFSGSNVFSNQNTMCRVCETMSGVNVVSNSCTVNFAHLLLVSFS
jgi:hypothetical protein